MSPVMYRVTKDGNPAEITVHLGRMKKYVVPRSSPVPDLDALDDLFLGTTLPVPDLEGSLSKVMIGAFTVESIDGYKRVVGAASLTNFQYHLKLQGYPTQTGVWRQVNAIPQCREMIASYRAAVFSTDTSAFNPPRGNLVVSPRMSRSTFTEIFLHCLVLFSMLLFFSHHTEQPLMSALVLLVPSFVLSCSYWSIYFWVSSPHGLSVVRCEHRAL